MVFDWAVTRATARQQVHGTFGLEAVFSPASGAVAFAIRARLHRRSETIEAGDFVTLAEQDRVVLQDCDFEGLTPPVRGDTLTFSVDGEVFELLTRDEPDPPYSIWNVRLRG